MKTTTLRAITEEQVDSYNEMGFLAPVDIFNQEEINGLEQKIAELETLLDPNETSYAIDGWEKHNSWLYRLVTNERLLDCVEGLLGPNFYQWGSNMMTKAPKEPLYVPWHQDLHDWPLWPDSILTAWVALDDVDEENACLQILPGTQRLGKLRHIPERPEPRAGSRSLLPFYVDPAYVDRTLCVPIRLRKGQVSFHHALVIHGSEGNKSMRRRGAFTTCYAATNVKCLFPKRDINGDWSNFSGFLCRGIDRFGFCPLRTPPTSFGRGPRKLYRELHNLEEGAVSGETPKSD
jgi:ectoine hydroxylase-related dioxygenase (phytanoyl-CoA dioxygenase family)